MVFRPGEPEGFALPPIGPPSRAAATRDVLQWLTDSGARRPRVERADRRLVAEIEAESDGGRTPLVVEADRDQFDYVYRTDALARLSGRSYAAKRRHVKRFQRGHPVVYEPLTTGGAVVLPKMAVPGVGWLAYFSDTEGNVFGMMEADESASLS